jgi:hypothetical protein
MVKFVYQQLSHNLSLFIGWQLSPKNVGYFMTNINASDVDFSIGNSSVSNLTVFQRNGIDVVINSNTGESFSSIRGYARMSGKAQSTVQSRVDRMPEGERTASIKTAEIHTPGGLQAVRLISEDLIAEWLPQDNPAMATKLIKLGIRGFMHQLAGFQVSSTAMMPSRSLDDDLELLAKQVQHALEMRREQRRLQEEQQRINIKVAVVEAEVQKINDRAIAADKELKALPASNKSVPSRSARANINSLIRGYCHKTNFDHTEAYKNLYREFRDRYHIDLKVRAANGKSAPLDIAESLDVIDDLYALACELFGGNTLHSTSQD